VHSLLSNVIDAHYYEGLLGVKCMDKDEDLYLLSKESLKLLYEEEHIFLGINFGYE